jgi:hypothetical protein
LREGLEAGDLYCRDSARFRSFDDDLVDEETFAQRADLLPRHGLEAAGRPIHEQLEELRTLLDERFEAVNRRILAGENAFVRAQDSRTVWERTVRSEEPLPNEPFFDRVERVDIDTLLLFVDRRNGFMEAFEHVLGRYRKAAPSKPAIIATLMAYATNIGLGRMADISNLTYQELSTIAGNFIRLETLNEANDRIANATARLPIFCHLDIDEAVHSSSDGQQVEAAIPTINARHSAKYFGLKKGMVAYTLLANQVPLGSSAPTSTRATLSSMSCSTTPPTSSRRSTPPIPAAPTRSTSPCCTCSATASRPGTATTAARWRPLSTDFAIHASTATTR